MSEKSLVTFLPEPIIQADPNGMPEQRDATFNPGVAKLSVSGMLVAAVRCTGSPRVGVPGKYMSHQLVYRSKDAVNWENTGQILRTPPMARGIGFEDLSLQEVGVTEDGESIIAVAGNVANQTIEEYEQGIKPEVRIAGSLAIGAELRGFDPKVIIQTHSPRRNRAKALGLASEENDDGTRTAVFTICTETSKGRIMIFKDRTVNDIFGIGQNPRMITPEEIANGYINYPEEHILIEPEPPVERGEEVGPGLIRVEDYWLHIVNSANHTRERGWGVEALVLDLKTYKILGREPNLILPAHLATDRVPNASFTKSSIYTKKGGYFGIDNELLLFPSPGDRHVALAYCDASEVIDRALDKGYTPPNQPY